MEWKKESNKARQYPLLLTSDLWDSYGKEENLLKLKVHIPSRVQQGAKRSDFYGLLRQGRKAYPKEP